MITEPYQGGAGFIFPPEGWLKKLEKWAHDRGLLFILDEVQSSFGRTGRMFMLEWEDLRPNMVCLGKGIGSGMPCSALAGESEIFDSMGVGEMSSTTGGNPLSCAAALAVLDVMRDEKLPENARKVGEYLMGRFKELQNKHECLGDVRGRVLVIGLEFVEARESRIKALGEKHRDQMDALREKHPQLGRRLRGGGKAGFGRGMAGRHGAMQGRQGAGLRGHT